ncbi:MAG: hypothetical protein ACLGSD_00350 [Acidobacteriota bacterium]
MDKLSALVATILAVSIASERIVEILKGLFPGLWLFEPRTGNPEARRCAAIHVLAGLCGVFVAWASGIDILTLLGMSRSPNGGSASHMLGYAIVGLLASGGSAFWNHVLDILQAAKVQREQQATAIVASAGLQAQTSASTPTQPAIAPARV